MQITDVGVKKLTKCSPKLTTLYFGQCVNLTEKPMRSIARHCGTRLYSFEAARCNLMITEQSLETLADLAVNISYLDITFTSVGDATMEVIADNVCIAASFAYANSEHL